MASKIIAFTGAKGVGKDTAAQLLIDRYGYTKASFAEPLKQVCKLAFGLTDEEMTDRVLKEKKLGRWPHESPRRLLQTVGTDMFRKHFPGVWIKALERTAAELLTGGGKVVITDLRFPDEADAIMLLHGTIVKIRRPGFEPSAEHASESYFEEILEDLVITNDFDTPAEFQIHVVDTLLLEGVIL